jgi:hypothetical protein
MEAKSSSYDPEDQKHKIVAMDPRRKAAMGKMGGGDGENERAAMDNKTPLPIEFLLPCTCVGPPSARDIYLLRSIY